MAFLHIASQDALGASTTTSVVGTYPGATTSGNLLLATVYANASTIAISGWTTLLGTQQLVTGSAHIQILYKLAAGTETTVTATASSASLMKIHIYEYSGNANPIALDGTASGNTSDPSAVASKITPNLTTTHNNSLIVAALGLSNAVTSLSWDSSFVDGQHDASVRLFDATFITSGVSYGVYSTTASWTTSVVGATIIGAFQADNSALTLPNNYRFVDTADPAGTGNLSATEKIK